MRIIHIADVHWRGLSRHEEYVTVFKQFFKKVKRLKPDIIYVGGDIVHSKTQGISPELIDNLIWWFKGMADICPVHVILGNHDGLMHNKDRQDAITPIINAIGHSNIHLYKDSGTYPTGIPGFNWCVFSCFDELNWVKVKPIEGEINIALYHGAVKGSLTDTDWQIDGEIRISAFDDYEFALLGDIHKRQFLNKEKTVAYCGSTIQQNYGEDNDKGFLVWDIKSSDIYKTKFYHLSNPKPFVTVDWVGNADNTLTACNQYPNGSRFRIRSAVPITQVETKRLQTELKQKNLAEEVVFKVESNYDMSVIETSSGDLKKRNLRDPKVQMSLIKDYYRGADFDDKVFSTMSEIVENYLMKIAANQQCLRNISWSINKMNFDDIFSYGSGNVINFDKLPGITGIFGTNARGKSAIIGALVYGLFNTTDRGNIKNIHIINSRKNMCKCHIDITVGGNKFRIERKTIKKTTKSGEWAPTSLNLYRLDDNDSVVEDLTEEQRRETEKIIRKMIGTADEFLMTSLASQGEINTFIKEKATARKAILTNFLDLQVFDQILEVAKKDSSEIRARSKIFENNNWDLCISETKDKLKEAKIKKKNVENVILKLNSQIDAVKSEMYAEDADTFITDGYVEEIERRLARTINEHTISITRVSEIKEETKANRYKLERVREFLDSFDIHGIKKKRDIQRRLEKKLADLRRRFEVQKKDLDNIRKSVKKLDTVPCGDMFPSCKFIKESHRNKNKLEKQETNVTALMSKVSDLEILFEEMKEEQLEEKIDKYNHIVQKRSEIEVILSAFDVELAQLNANLSVLDDEIDTLSNDLADAKSKLSNEDNAIIIRCKEKLDDLNSKKNLLRSQRDDFISEITTKKMEVKRLKENKKQFDKIHNELKVYDTLIQAVSNKGIPLQLINTMLPAINSEIAKILQGVVSFTVELDSNLESNSMDIYINYGDSRRIIELGSGMEKMIASLAIRVALINVSSMSKTNSLIIDEGFGSLDEMNLEACGRLLKSLKKWFKNIIVISHVDAIKDNVDFTLDISKKGKDSYVYSA